MTWGDDTVEPLVALEPAGTGNRLNDGRATRDGKMIVGSMYENTRDRRSSGQLHLVQPDGTSETLPTAIGVSNGQAFSPDGVYYFADTFERTIWAYDWTDGRPTNERVFFEFDG